MRKIRALQIISANDNGGGGVHVLNLFSSDIDDFENELCLIGDGELINKAISKKIKTYKVKNKNINSELVEIINNNDYHIINFHGARAAKIHWFIKGKIKVPTVITIHSNFNEDFSNLKGLKRFISTAVFKKSIKRFKNFIAVSENIKELLRLEKYSDDSSVVYNGVDVDKIKALSKEPCEYDLNKKDGEFIFVSCARFHPVKNHERIILAFNEMCKKYDNLKLILIGEGSEYEKIIEMTKVFNIDNKVIFLGQVENPYKYIISADINLIVSLDEGGVPPLAILEGFALGKTAIISRLPFIEKSINIKNVFICEQESVLDIRNAMEDAYKSEELEKLGTWAVKHALDNFTIDAFCERYKSAYIKIIREGQSEK